MKLTQKLSLAAATSCPVLRFVTWGEARGPELPMSPGQCHPTWPLLVVSFANVFERCVGVSETVARDFPTVWTALKKV